MKLFEFHKESYTVRVSEEALLLKPFKAIYDRDKSKDKDRALNEIAYVWFFSDLTSPYISDVDEKERSISIMTDLDLPKGWKVDKLITEAIDFYRSISKTSVHHLYDSAMKAAAAVNEILSDSKALIDEAKDKIEATEKVIRALGNVPKVMQSLRAIEKELIREIEEKDGKKLGSKTMNTFEDGLILD